MSRVSILLLAFPLATLAGVLHKPHDVACNHLVIFGDSLSDDGIEADTEDTNRVSHGFARNSNGAVWPEYLQRMLGCHKYHNFAYSGARSGMGNFYFANWSGVNWQIERFAAEQQSLGTDTIVILQAGGITDYFTGENNTDVVVGNLHGALVKLLDTMEGGTIMLLNLVDPTSAPGMQTTEKSEDVAQRIAPLVTETNRLLTHMVYDSELGLHKRGNKVNLRLVDLNSIAYRSMANMNTQDAFTHHSAETKPRSAYSFAYHDLWHPSTFVHNKFAKYLLRELQDL